MGLRYRESYQTRHTFATLALTAGANPSYIARQLGYTNANMLFRVYSKWIDGANKSHERDKLNLGFGHDLATELIAVAKNFAQSEQFRGERGVRTHAAEGLQRQAQREMIPNKPPKPHDLATDLATLGACRTFKLPILDYTELH